MRSHFRPYRHLTVAAACLALWTGATLAGGPPAVPVISAQSAATATAVPTSTKTWIGQGPQIETHLKGAAVTSIEDIGTGVTRPRRAHLEPGEPVESLVWKVLPPGKRNGFWESYKSEIAGYELDKLLGMNMVPPAVERTIGNETGAAVMWLTSVKSVKEMGGKVPSGPAWNGPLRRMVMFDNLIANTDRNGGNILIGNPGELILIDHSRAFITDRKLPRKLERVDLELWERMTALTRDDLERALGPWISDYQISAILARRDMMVNIIEKLVAQKGRDLVIIP